MAKISKGASSSATSQARSSQHRKSAAPSHESDEGNGAIAFISRKGVDGAYVIPPGPKHDATSGRQIGWDEGVYLDFQGVGVTRAYFPEKKKADRIEVERVKEIMEDGGIADDIGLEILQPEAPRPPFAKWDTTSASAIKIALSVTFEEDDHEANVKKVQDAVKYEKANEGRSDVLAVLNGLLATEAAQTDEYDVEVSVS